MHKLDPRSYSDIETLCEELSAEVESADRDALIEEILVDFLPAVDTLALTGDLVTKALEYAAVRDVCDAQDMRTFLDDMLFAVRVAR